MPSLIYEGKPAYADPSIFRLESVLSIPKLATFVDGLPPKTGDRETFHPNALRGAIMGRPTLASGWRSERRLALFYVL